MPLPKTLKTEEIGGHVYKIIERHGWRTSSIWYLKDGKRISGAAYRAETTGQALVEKEVVRGTCQICGRPIGFTTGTIAHHGYRRPWHRSGIQTASCSGARELAFEVSRDVLGAELKTLADIIVTKQGQIAIQLRDHPKLIKTAGFKSRKTGEWVEPVYLAKDEDIRHAGETWAYDPYDSLEQDWLRHARHELKTYEDTLKFQQARYDAWKPQEI